MKVTKAVNENESLEAIMTSTCVVTVTYGERSHFVEELIPIVQAYGVSSVIVVDNASTPKSQAVLQEIENKSAGVVTLLSISENTGSAGGYKAGLEYFLRCSGCEYVWLLDDDNRPTSEAFEALSQCYIDLMSLYSRSRLAAVSLREAFKPLAEGQPVKYAFPRKSSFQGFHVLDMPRKFRKIFFGSVRNSISEASRFIEIPYSYYGGLFFHSSVLENIGMPDERFFVYGDDLEFSHRITRANGKIFLVPSSVINDFDHSWNTTTYGSNPFSRKLNSSSDFHVYYGSRNGTYFHSFFWKDSSFLYKTNKYMFLTILFVFSLALGRVRQFSNILLAVKEGEKGLLGRRDKIFTKNGS